MPYLLPDLSSPLDLPFDDVIDVRSPAEFAEDHVPGAISLPVLDNEERAVVGTIYKQESPFKARKLGAALVARNAARHLEGPLAAKDGGWRPLVYCWRGGQRSNSFGSILTQVGWRTEVLAGGYQSYRRALVAALYDRALPHRFVLIDGDTGTAKTEILHLVAARGGQVLDLEGLANHRGSVLGPRPGGQPSQKMLESRLTAHPRPARPRASGAGGGGEQQGGRSPHPPRRLAGDACRATHPLAGERFGARTLSRKELRRHRLGPDRTEAHPVVSGPPSGARAGQSLEGNGG